MPSVIIAIQPLIRHCSEDFMTVDGVNHRNDSVGYYRYLRRNRHRTVE